MDHDQSRWNTHLPYPNLCWFGFPPFREYQIRLAFGAEALAHYGGNANWMHEITADRFLVNRPVRDILSLCSGFGVVEWYYLYKLPGVKFCLGLDAAPEAVRVAQERVKGAGAGHQLGYRVADLNAYSWPEAAYDLVLANGALHHLEALETVCAGIKRTLRPGGILYANEVIGPSQQDHRQRQIELINALAYLVPPELRGTEMTAPFVNADAANPFRFGLLRGSLKAHLQRVDPTEGVRSAEIVSILKQTFMHVHVFPYGGSLLAYALDQMFYRNFRPDDPAHRALLDVLFHVEEHALNTGQVDQEHALIVAHD